MRPAIAILRNAISRRCGWRGLSLVLAFALLWVGSPRLELHSHAAGDPTHAHAQDAHGRVAPVDLDAPGAVHLHDASSVTWTLTASPALIAAVPVATWIPPPTVDSGAIAPLPPPHRPPIA